MLNANIRMMKLNPLIIGEVPGIRDTNEGQQIIKVKLNFLNMGDVLGKWDKNKKKDNKTSRSQVKPIIMGEVLDRQDMNQRPNRQP